MQDTYEISKILAVLYIGRGELAIQYRSEPEFLNIFRAQESIPRNHFRQPMQPGGPIRQPYSYSVPSPHRLFKNSSTRLFKNMFMLSFMVVTLKFKIK